MRQSARSLTIRSTLAAPIEGGRIGDTRFHTGSMTQRIGHRASIPFGICEALEARGRSYDVNWSRTFGLV